ncbi:fluoride efflux transporter CrcB [Glaciihabitans sp. UYNi722]|uniref:fluoride efflux transporter CrcB n=1 Tax=Glaciihabitans sp. UYNi722 TaxID=3156344 RepID=UPI00339A3A1B
MTVVTFLLLSVAGGVGAALRLLVDGLVRNRVTTAYPFGTTIINISGSLLLGVITGLAAGHLVPEELRLVFGVGLMGGYTTFSTASFETVRLIQSRRYAVAVVNGPGMLVVAVAAAALGLWIGSLQ